MNSKGQIKRILVAEDDPIIGQLLNMQLVKEGYQVVHAADGSIAWELLNQDDPPDLVLLDILMPGLDGFEVCRLIRATPHLATLPVVMLTALQDARSRLEGIRAGANDFLSKPWNTAELQARITTLLKLKDVQDTLQQQHKQLGLLYDISRELNTYLDLNQMLASILTRSARLCDAEHGSIILYADIWPMRKIQLCADCSQVGYEISPVMNPTETRIANRLADSPQPFLIDDASIIKEFEQTTMRSLLATPFIHQGKLQGFMMLEQKQPDFFTNEHLMLFNSIAQQATVTIENISLFEHIQEERQRFAVLINNMNDAVIATGSNNEIILINPAGLKLLNLDKESIIGCPVTKVLGIQPLAEPFQQVASAFTPVSQEFEWSDGRTLYATISPVGSGGQLAVIQDITNMIKLQAIQLAAEQENTARVRATFERYMSPALVDRTLSEERGLMEKRERRTAAVLFASLKGFTRLTHRFPAYNVIDVLNEYFTMMTQIVYAHNGAIFDTVGDKLMVGFGVPFELPDPVMDAIQTGIEMQTVFGELAARWWLKFDERRLGMGIGIDYGTVVVGNVGSATRMNYTLVGSPVNTAQSLASTAADREIRFLEIIKSRLIALENELTIQTITGVQLEGRDKPETIYNLLVNSPEPQQ